MFQKNRKHNKWTAIFLISALLLTSCAFQNGGTAKPQAENGETTQAENGEGGEKSMGRYLEKEITLPEEATSSGSFPTAYLQRLNNGSLELIEQIAGKYISEDNGETWTAQEAPWLTDISRNAYIADIALAKNGAAAVIYSPHEEETPEADTENGEDNGEKDTGAGSADTQESGAEEENPEEDSADGVASAYNPSYLYVDAEGNTKPILFESKDDYIHYLCFDRENRLYAYTINREVYEINPEDNSMKKLFVTEGLADYVCFTEKYMFVITSMELAVYDLELGMLSEEDTVLQDFVLENVGDAIGSNSDGHSIIAAAGEEEDVLYFAYSGGLYRHVIGGGAMEQIVDGAISSFGDPMMVLEDMAVLPDNEFAVLYNDARLYRYSYDPDVPTVPEERIDVYSLTENYSMKQAVSLFQKKNPEVYVRYEIGMSGEDSVTRQDAIRNLNTKMMSGEGPDILVLDGLPEASYREKGILADISGTADGMSGEDALFSNIVEACRIDGKLYALPMRFQLPMIAGDTETVRQAADLGSLADRMEKLRQENPKGALLGIETADELLYLLGQVSSAAWTKRDGGIDEAALREFLTAAERIYQAETAGYETEGTERYSEREFGYNESFPGEENYSAATAGNALYVAMGKRKFAVGKVYRLDFDFNMITTLAGQEENFSYGGWNGQIADGFIPNGMVGVSANAAGKELVMEFYRFLFGREFQDLDLSGGFPINRASFESFAQSPRPEEFGGGSIAITDEEDDIFSVDLRWADAEDFARLKELAENASRSCIGDATIEEAVREAGVKVLEGRESVKEGVDEIMKKAAIYLAE